MIKRWRNRAAQRLNELAAALYRTEDRTLDLEDSVQALRESVELLKRRPTIVAGAVIDRELIMAEKLSALANAVEFEQVLLLDYENGDLATRVFSPWSVYTSQKGDILAHGWDHTRKALRQFRLDRIHGIEADEDHRPYVSEAWVESLRAAGARPESRKPIILN